eukprot:scaffold3461_cov116-Isochrysis_galbana.AAC.5
MDAAHLKDGGADNDLWAPQLLKRGVTGAVNILVDPHQRQHAEALRILPLLLLDAHVTANFNRPARVAQFEDRDCGAGGAVEQTTRLQHSGYLSQQMVERAVSARGDQHPHRLLLSDRGDHQPADGSGEEMRLAGAGRAPGGVGVSLPTRQVYRSNCRESGSPCCVASRESSRSRSTTLAVVKSTKRGCSTYSAPGASFNLVISTTTSSCAALHCTLRLTVLSSMQSFCTWASSTWLEGSSACDTLSLPCGGRSRTLKSSQRITSTSPRSERGLSSHSLPPTPTANSSISSESAVKCTSTGPPPSASPVTLSRRRRVVLPRRRARRSSSGAARRDTIVRCCERRFAPGMRRAEPPKHTEEHRARVEPTHQHQADCGGAQRPPVPPGRIDKLGRRRGRVSAPPGYQAAALVVEAPRASRWQRDHPQRLISKQHAHARHHAARRPRGSQVRLLREAHHLRQGDEEEQAPHQRAHQRVVLVPLRKVNGGRASVHGRESLVEPFDKLGLLRAVVLVAHRVGVDAAAEPDRVGARPHRPGVQPTFERIGQKGEVDRRVLGGGEC